MLFCITETERASKRELPLGGVHSDCCWRLIHVADGLLTCVARGGSNCRGTAGEALVLDDPVGGRAALVSGAMKAAGRGHCRRFPRRTTPRRPPGRIRPPSQYKLTPHRRLPRRIRPPPPYKLQPPPARNRDRGGTRRV